jgi:ribosome biogenesis protein ERB1
LTYRLRDSKAILIHQLSKKFTQRHPFKLHGLPVSAVFHPTRSIFFVSTKKNVRVYDLLKQKLIKKLETGLREVSSISVHPAGLLPILVGRFSSLLYLFILHCSYSGVDFHAGDNVIVGSRDGKLCWFDMDLSSKPYKVLKYAALFFGY